MINQRDESPHTAEGIFQRIEHDIASGVYKSDSLLPSIRDLASKLQVSPATVAAAFRKLSDRGLTYATRGVGTKVRHEALLSETLGTGPPIASTRGVDVASGAPDPALLPDLLISLRRIQAPKTLYNVELMLPELRELGQELMADTVKHRPTHLSIASGALDSISEAVSARLRPGDRIIVEDPGFAAASSLLRSHALTLVPVPVDDAGFEVEAFAAAVKQGVNAVLYSPRAQNPFGSSLTEKRAHDLSEIISQSNKSDKQIFVIENDHACLISNVNYHSLTPSTDVWLSTRSLSKSLGPDLRFAFVAGDAHIIERIKRRQALNRGWISTILQHLVSDLLTDASVQQRVAQAGPQYEKRRSRLITALGNFDIRAYGRSGLNVFVPVNDEGTVSNALLTLGWQSRSGQAYRHQSGPFIRLTPAALTDDQIDTLAGHVARTLHTSTPVLR